MQRLTQTNLEPGNCWQYAWACVLDVDPATMPDQVAIEANPDKNKSSYNNAIQAYLYKHHASAFVRVDGPVMRAVEYAGGYHVIVGTTVRTTEERRIHHCVVGFNGAYAWDVHPSRAGLVKPTHWELLVPFPAEWERPGWRSECVCPACAGQRFA